jgi:hypothetical protein
METLSDVHKEDDRKRPSSECGFGLKFGRLIFGNICELGERASGSYCLTLSGSIQRDNPRLVALVSPHALSELGSVRPFHLGVSQAVEPEDVTAFRIALFGLRP